MHFIIRFTTDKFDVTKEDENPINPIFGQSLLLWLKDKVSDKLEFDEPDAEDWGWYTYISWAGRSYMLGASTEGDGKNGNEWVFQVDKLRTFKEKLFGKEKMTKEDQCLLFFKSIFDSEPEFKDVEIE